MGEKVNRVKNCLGKKLTYFRKKTVKTSVVSPAVFNRIITSCSGKAYIKVER